ncbi:MAG: tRNA uridine(34) 5-carboxymethylaminomethyl modification radical SAM/GNAT enzyme Elp3 [Thermoplasmata archaeon]
MQPLAELAERVLSGELEGNDLHRAKLELCRKHGLTRVPSNHQILQYVPEERRSSLSVLRKKPVRTASGVAIVAVMTSPAPCPHGKCVYCPGGVDWGTPQAYTGTEPAAMRAAQHEYDPGSQTETRLRQLQQIGHATDKVELIIIGGTFTARPEAYREAFVKDCFDALNGSLSSSLDEAHRMNETADRRCIGLTIETKPDCFLGREVEHSLRLGVTRVELGVQSLCDDVLRRVNRGHGVDEVVEATRRAKDAGLKVGYHMMPGLPGSTYERDLDSFRELFDNPDFRPDMLKVYPTLVIEGTGLHRMWLQGEYREMDTEEAARLLAEAKRYVPPYVRILRIQREIPAREIEAGVRKGHLRQLIREIMEASGHRCRCIRCREAGLRRVSVDPQDVSLGTIRYRASGGLEYFLSYEDFNQEVLVGYARLRLCSASAYLRELKVFGQMVPFQEDPGRRWQHKGYGKALMAESEALARDGGHDLLCVTSGAGARGYYRKLGYEQQGAYMVKRVT